MIATRLTGYFARGGRFFRALAAALALGTILAAAGQARAQGEKHTFYLYTDESAYLLTEVETFSLEKAAPGVATLKLTPFRPELEYSILALGRKTEFGEEAAPGEATWLAYVPESGRVVVRLAATIKPSDLPENTVVLSAQQARQAIEPLEKVEKGLEAARALQTLGFTEDALALLGAMVENPAYKSYRCLLQKNLLDLRAQTADADPAQPLSGPSLKVFQAILAECQGAEANDAARWFAERALKRIEAASLSDEDAKVALSDALRLCLGRPGGDQLLLALARIHYRQGNAEEGAKALDDLDTKYDASLLKDEARALRDRIARRAPARAHNALGALGPGPLRSQFLLKSVTDATFDPQGRLIVLDRESNPSQIAVFSVDFGQRALLPLQTIPLFKKYEPLSVARAGNGEFFVLEKNKKQVIVLDERGEELYDRTILREGEGWKLRSPLALRLARDKELLILDPGSGGVLRFEIPSGRYIGLITLKGVDLEDARFFTTSPTGMAGAASRQFWSAFSPADGPKTRQSAMRGRTVRIEVDGIGMCRWGYVYLFDRATKKLEKFRQNGLWLTTVIDCSAAGVREPAVWAISPEGDAVLYDRSKDQFFAFVQ